MLEEPRETPGARRLNRRRRRNGMQAQGTACANTRGTKEHIMTGRQEGCGGQGLGGMLGGAKLERQAGKLLFRAPG